jgi:hypothetical protein
MLLLLVLHLVLLLLGLTATSAPAVKVTTGCPEDRQAGCACSPEATPCSEVTRSPSWFRHLDVSAHALLRHCSYKGWVGIWCCSKRIWHTGGNSSWSFLPKSG